MASTQALQVHSARLWDSLMALAQIGATAKGGVRRLALSDLDRQARDLVCGWFREAGLSLRVDQIGNVFARREGTAPELPAVATGSHIDTQPSGGKFDGNYGVLAGLEVVRCLNDAGIRTKRSVEICIWTNEEGSRFTPVMMGSGVWAGAFSLEQAQQAQDATGMTVLEALRAIGYEGEFACGPSLSYPSYHAYLEAHIEQGPVLEDAGIPIGEVIGALGQRWFDVRIQGMDAHAGPTPMDLRQDALLAAAKVVQEVNAIAIAHHPYGRGTVGSLRVEPNSRNVIPGFVQCSVDFRHPNLEGLMAMESRLRDFAHQLAAPYRLGIEIEKVSEFAPCQFSSLCLEAIKESISALGLSSMPIVSGAGHDAVYVARQSPAAMIFIPCKDGISHNEIEDALPEHIEAGANVLLGAMMRLTAQ
ncbi:MAG: Zn-dependent hydrolase [Betaproteobacteria bacterium]|nr:Zn-dependent hydrolase [Betaproteobacteria bacterium]